MDEYEEMGRAAVIERIDEVLGDGPVYISLGIAIPIPMVTYSSGMALSPVSNFNRRAFPPTLREL